MNTSQKCNCCSKEDVCKYKERYEYAVEQILNCNVAYNAHSIELMSIEPLKNTNFVEVSIKCPFMATQSTTIRSIESK